MARLKTEGLREHFKRQLKAKLGKADNLALLDLQDDILDRLLAAKAEEEQALACAVLDVIQADFDDERLEAITLKLDETKKSKLSELKSAAHMPTKSERAAAAAKGTLVGGVVGVGTFAALKSKGKSTFSLFGGGDNVMQGVLAGTTGAMATAVVTKVLTDQRYGALGKDNKDFQESLAENEFSSAMKNTFAEMSDRFFHCFYFRDLMRQRIENNEDKLLWLGDARNADYTEDEKQQFLNELDAYFITSLSRLLAESFEHFDARINDKDHPHLHQLWDKIRGRDNIKNMLALECQMAFMQSSAAYIDKRSYDKKWRYLHPWLFSASAPLAIGVVVTSTLILLSVAVPFIIASVGVSVAITGLSMFLLGKLRLRKRYHSDASFKRKESDRLSLHAIADKIRQAKDGLHNHLQKQVKRTEKLETKNLETFTHASGRFNKMRGKHKVLLGSSAAWLRETAERWVSNRSFAELNKTISEIRHESIKQSKVFIDEFRHDENTETLEEALKETKSFLRARENRDFIESFEIKQKIKEQLLGLVAKEPALARHKKLREFYKKSCDGNAADLDQKVICRHALNHLTTAFTELQQAFLNHPNPQAILHGHGDTAHALHLGTYQDAINPENIKTLLANSFFFLSNLAMPMSADTDFEAKAFSSDAFIVYRAILLEQLAHIYEPSAVDGEVEKQAINAEIETFLREKLDIHAGVVLDDYYNHHYFKPQLDRNHQPRVSDEYGNSYLKEDLKYVQKLCCLDMAYNGAGFNYRQILEGYMHEYLHENPDKNIMGVYATPLLDVRTEANYAEQIDGVLNDTRGFVRWLKSKSNAFAKGIADRYQIAILQQLSSIFFQIMQACAENTTLVDRLKPAALRIKTYLNKYGHEEDIREFEQLYQNLENPENRATLEQQLKEIKDTNRVQTSENEDDEAHNEKNRLHRFFRHIKPKDEKLSKQSRRHLHNG